MFSLSRGKTHAGQRRRTPMLLPICLAAAAALAPFTGARAASSLIPGYFLGQGMAIEAEAQAGPLGISLGNASAIGCPCRGTNGHTIKNTVSTLSVGIAGNILTAGVNTSTAYGLKTDTTASTEQTTHIAGINLLGGLITADAIKAVANVGVTATALTPSFAGSKLVHLVIAGQPIKANVKENTVINLAGLGSVTIKFVNSQTYGNQSAGVEVEMLRVDISAANDFGLPIGATLIVGEAYAGYDRTQPKASLGGYGETLSVTAQAGTLLQEAATAGAISGIPGCLGTNGQTLTDNVANIGAGDLLSVDAATTSAFGGPVGKAQVAETTSSVGAISLLNGLITAGSVTAVAQETRQDGKSVASSLGSSFGGLYVAGVQIAANVPANTVIDLAGLGFLVLNEQPPAVDDHIQVNGMHIVITIGNQLGLPIGAEIFLAHAEATAGKF